MALSYNVDCGVKIAPTTLPNGAFEGQIGYIQSTNLFYVFNGTSWIPFGSGGGSSVRRNSIHNPRISPSAYDDEFESTALDAKWTVSVSGTTVVSGTVNPLATVTPDCIQDLHGTWPSWLLIQSDESDAQSVTYTQPWTATTDATFMFNPIIYIEDNAAIANDRRSIYLRLTNSGDANEWVHAAFDLSGAARQLQLQVNNNGVTTTDNSLEVGATATGFTEALLLFKQGNDYTVGRVSDFLGGKHSSTTVTKTGVTTFDQIELIFKTDPNTPSSIMGVDYVRVYNSITFGFKNP